ncbi:MAG: DUF86 domain-containing protein, partial [Nitrospinota bacterium]
MKDDLVYIRHIQDAIDKISKYIGNYAYEDFINDQKTVDAVIRNIEIIGEASTKCSNKLKKKYGGIPWQKMVSARNKMIHDYMGVMTDIIWGICKDDLPALKKQLAKHFGEEY